MELPFLDKKNRQGVGVAQVAKTSDETDQVSLLEGSAKELIDAIHRKDIGAMKGSLTALYHMLKD